MVLCPFHRSHREICTWNRPVSETKFLDDFFCLPAPLFYCWLCCIFFPDFGVVKTVFLANGGFAGATPAIFVIFLGFPGREDRNPLFWWVECKSSSSPFFRQSHLFLGVDKRVVSKRVVLADVPPERKPERGYIRRMFPRNENRNEGTFGGCFPGPKTGTRVRSTPFYETALHCLPVIDGQNRQSPIASVQRTRSTLASHSAVPRGTNAKWMNANRAIRIAAQWTQGLRGLISVFRGEIWQPTNASDSNRSDNSRQQFCNK